MSTIANVEAMHELAASGCLAADDAQALVEHALEQLDRAIGLVGIETEPGERVNALQTRLRSFHTNGTPFPTAEIDPSEVEAYRKVFWAVTMSAPSPQSAKEIIDAILKRLEG